MGIIVRYAYIRGMYFFAFIGTMACKMLYYCGQTITLALLLALLKVLLLDPPLASVHSRMHNTVVYHMFSRHRIYAEVQPRACTTVNQQS